MNKLWFDFTNPPHVNFYLPLIKYFRGRNYNISLTARDFVETTKLLEINNLIFKLVGKHGGKNKISKLNKLIQRNLALFFKADSFDLSFSSNYDAPLISWLRRKPSLVFDDNDISPNWLYSKFASYVISPESINKESMHRMGIKPDRLITYNGFKENIYVADYIPDDAFLDKIPFKEYVVVRPENLKASYVSASSVSIVSVLVNMLVKKGINVLYLPRYESDKAMVKKHERIYIPSTPLNGLDVCFFSNAVLTGAGTFSREAAVLGIPAVSFYAGNNFLGVDKKMFSENRIFFSRDPNEIVHYILSSEKKEFNKQHSVSIQQEFFQLVNELVLKLITK